jgi:hypothetical protein
VVAARDIIACSRQSFTPFPMLSSRLARVTAFGMPAMVPLTAATAQGQPVSRAPVAVVRECVPPAVPESTAVTVADALPYAVRDGDTVRLDLAR